MKLKLSILVAKLKPLEHKYAELAVLLGVENFRENEAFAGNVDRCLCEVIEKWYELKGDDAPSKELLQEALEGIGQRGLSNKLMEKYKGKKEKYVAITND